MPRMPGHAHRHGHDHGHRDGHGHGHEHSQGHDHGHSHSHGHAHGHGGHSHGPAEYDRAFAIAAAANMAFVLAEVSLGVAANSLALVADGIHNLSDVAGLLLGWGASWLARRAPSARRTYGWGRATILASLANAVVLLVGTGAMAVEAAHKLLAPEPVATGTVMAVAAAGIAVNGGTALLFLRGRKGDLNIRAQFLHLGADALVSLGVVAAALAVRLTGLDWIDPAAGLAVAVVVVVSTWGLLRESVDLVMDAVPARVRESDVRDWLAALPGVAEVHDLHIWGLSTTETALTAHLVAGDAPVGSAREVAAALRERFGIGHATIQIETAAEAELCWLRPGDRV
jgi:cobalt-zinc-cadmium efflux system protein